MVLKLVARGPHVAREAFGSFQIFNICVAKCLEKRRCEITESKLNGTVAVFVPAVALQTAFHFPGKFWEIGSVLMTLHMFCRPRESIRPDSLWKALGSVAWVRCWRPPVTGRQVTVLLLKICVRVGRVKSWRFTVGVGLRQGCMLPPLLFKGYISGSQAFRWRDPNPDPGADIGRDAGMHLPPTRPKEVLTWHFISLRIMSKIFLYCTLLGMLKISLC